jgi:serine/threonine-protein kinase
VARVLRRGSQLGKYRLVSRLGRGGFAEVWKARDSVMDIDVALKIAHADIAREWGREVLEHEARIASRLQHPGIVSVRNADWIEGRFVIATDLAIGNLDEYPRARRSASEALDIIRQVAAGLAYAHGRRVMHRDVKPENILIFADGRAALCDFGSSRIDATRSYTEAGTLGYMAPEQAYGRVRFASDVFSLGIIAYEVLTGVLPSWPFEWPPERHQRFAAKVPEPLQPVLRRAAEFDPRRRYGDASEFHTALERAFAKVEAPPPQAQASQTPEECAARLCPGGTGRSLPPGPRQGSGSSLPVPSLRGSHQRGDDLLPLVWVQGQLLSRGHGIPPGLPQLRARRPSRVDLVPLVLRGPLRGQWPQAPARPPRRTHLCGPKLRGPAPALHALLPQLQAQTRPPLVALRTSRSLPQVSLAHQPHLPPLLPLVRAPRTPRRHLPRQSRLGELPRTESWDIRRRQVDDRCGIECIL